MVDAKGEVHLLLYPYASYLRFVMSLKLGSIIFLKNFHFHFLSRMYFQYIQTIGLFKPRKIYMILA